MSHLKKSNPRGWYRNLKMLMKVDSRNDKPEVESIKHMSPSAQAEVIADSFAKVSQEYLPIDRSKIELPELQEDDILKIGSEEVLEVLRSLKLNKAAPKSDVPARILKRFAEQL